MGDSRGEYTCDCFILLSILSRLLPANVRAARTGSEFCVLGAWERR